MESMLQRSAAILTSAQSALRTFQLTYQDFDGQQVQVDIQQGDVLFVLGANGTGKSSLMLAFTNQCQGRVLRISAHRQVWLHSSALDLTPASRRDQWQHMNNNDASYESRYRDVYGATRSQIAIYDLLEAERLSDKRIADAVRELNQKLVDKLRVEPSPLNKLTSILKLCNLNFSIRIDSEGNVKADRDGYKSFGIDQLSDGERNALFIVASVLTAPSNIVIILDEPERHLHRSIISPLISTLLMERSDCAFVISTHDIYLPIDNPRGRTLLVRGYHPDNARWDIDILESSDIERDVEIFESILGSKKKILFVEGNRGSLDNQIYQVLFPDVTVRALGSCIDVERVVKGVRALGSESRVLAIGLIDRDDRESEECEILITDGIIPLDFYSVESIYYHPEIIFRLLERMSSVKAIDVNKTLRDIKDKILLLVAADVERLAARLVQRKIKNIVSKMAPDYRVILARSVSVEYHDNTEIEKEIELIKEKIRNSDVAGIITRYPIRETPILGWISSMSGFRNKEEYEAAVRKMALEDESTKIFLKDVLSPVVAAIYPN